MKPSDKPDMGEQIGRLTDAQDNYSKALANHELAIRQLAALCETQRLVIAVMELRIRTLELQNSVLLERSVNQGVALDLQQAELQEHERKGLAASAVAAFVLIVVAIAVAKALG